MAPITPPAEESPLPAANGLFTPTAGRPNKWTASRQRKLIRLYLNTRLSPKDIPKVLRDAEWEPGKESTVKTVSNLLDSEPRWLRPKNQEELDKRTAGLAECKEYRRNKRKLSQPKGSILSPPDSTGTSGCSEGLASDDFLRPGPVPDTPNVFIGSSSGMISMDSTSNNLDHSGYESLQWLPASEWETQLQKEPSFPSRQLPFGFEGTLNDFLPADQRSVSVDTSTRSLQRRLPYRSSSTLRNVKRLVSDYSITGSSDATLTSTAYSVSINTEDGSFARTLRPRSTVNHLSQDGPLLLASALLNVDNYKRQQGLCIPGLRTHDSKSCWCAVVKHLGPKRRLWVYVGGLIGAKPYVDDLPRNAISLCQTFNDEFGNTVLHLLAARGAALDLLIEAIEKAKIDPNTQNMAGETFLHVLPNSFFEMLSESTLEWFLRKLVQFQIKLDICDVFGRTFLHILSHQLQHWPKYILLQSWSMIDIESKMWSTRDAFGWTVIDSSARHSTVTAAREQHISLPSRSPKMDSPSNTFEDATLIILPGPATSSDHALISKHARLLETARLAFDSPSLEDYDGRNGLQCLAEASMRMSIKNNKVPLSTSLKRKRDEAGLHSPAARLILRYDLVQWMIEKKVSINHYDKQGTTVLMAFVKHLCDGEDDKVLANLFHHLIQKRADQHARNRRGETALHVAVRLGRKVATKVLLETGANVHALTVEGKGVVAVGEKAFFAARDDPKLYSSIIACIALVMQYGGVRAPTLVQEWSMDEGLAVQLMLQKRRKVQEMAVQNSSFKKSKKTGSIERTQ